jgi:uncharacterized protein
MAALRCFFVSDLHGRPARLRSLWAAVLAEQPAAVFIGGDLLPPGVLAAESREDEGACAIQRLFGMPLRRLRDELGSAYPSVFAILGNDDPRIEEGGALELARDGLWEYMHGRRAEWAGFEVFGYNCVPPTPFRLKDWERYDVSRFVDPGSVSPEDGWRTVPVAIHDIRWATIQRDLSTLVGEGALDQAILLLHAPPYASSLDRAALDGVAISHVPLDVHVGSIAVARLIESRHPRLTLHGHVHESARITGAWREQIGRTIALSAAHDGPELALVRFDPQLPADATRELVC